MIPTTMTKSHGFASMACHIEAKKSRKPSQNAPTIVSPLFPTLEP